ncbi:BRD4-interacting chromatin-remodeling complex-associated protein-like [Paramormyrops kingsleyae]|uniref:BICRA like chromatin remodeling complex associated protein n=1 Tax=Paramormyrops kingsleyae TaxID=1676925 RepID=A0A3B3RI33_9TELE|nr:BRD4-interacting chromatin-remodeling complex-associated protein-like [Paramormyrops kingsleyae]XP_023676924.1 BRD4-interacting chromatin-remodeling complex-associated protein-like [Paramormyrops kingsleyae]
MDDEDDRRLLDIIGDVQALNDYLHGSSNKSIDEDDVANAAFGSASFFISGSVDPVSALNDSANHLGEVDGATLQLPSSLQFIEEELGRASPSAAELGEEQPFDILQKSLQEADITEQTLAQEALLESPSSSLAFPQQLVSGGVGMSPCAQFTGVQSQGFHQGAPPPAVPNGSAAHIQLMGSFGEPASMVTISGLERPQILLQPGQPDSPGLAGGALVQRPSCATGATPGATFSPSTGGGQVSMPFKGSTTPIPLQNIIIQRGPSPQMLVKPIQPKPLQVGGQTVYSVSGLGLQPQGPAPGSGTYATGPTQSPQQMTVNIVNQPGLQKPALGPQVANHSGSIVIHSAVGQQHQTSLPLGQYRLPSTLPFTPGTATPAVQALNGQVLQTQVQGTSNQGFVTQTATSTYSGAFLTNQSMAVQLVSGQNFLTAGQLVVNQSVVSSQLGQCSPALVQMSQTPAVAAKAPVAFTAGSSALGSAPVQGHYALVNATDSASVGYATQVQTMQGTALPGGQELQLGSQFLVSREQDSTRQLQPETHLPHQNQDSQFTPSVTKMQDGQRQPQLVNLLGHTALKASAALETVVYLPNQLGSTPTVGNQVSMLKRPAPRQLTKSDMILQQLQWDQARALAPDRSPFSSLEDAARRLLAYHVFQGALPSSDDLRKVDEEFEEAASHALKRTQAMLSKYQRLLLVEAERVCPSSEIVMIDRTFNQEERRCLTQDKRLAMVDPEGYLEDFCCLPKLSQTGKGDQVSPLGGADPVSMADLPREFPCLTSSMVTCFTHRHGDGTLTEVQLRGGSRDPSVRTEPQPGCKDPGGGTLQQQQPGVSISAHLETAIKSVLDPKKTQGCSLSMVVDGNASSHSAGGFMGPHAGQNSPHLLKSPADADSALEAAVNSILEC